MINDHSDPPTKWPALRQGERLPRCPETRTGRYRRKIYMPNVIRFFGGNYGAGGVGRWLLRFGLRRLIDDPSDGRGTQVKPSPAERLCDLDLAHVGTQYLKPLDRVPHEVRKLVDRRLE